MATAAVVGAAAATTAAIIGSTVYDLPAKCSETVTGGLTYFDCGGAWYQAEYLGSGVAYVVVNSPR